MSAYSTEVLHPSPALGPFLIEKAEGSHPLMAPVIFCGILAKIVARQQSKTYFLSSSSNSLFFSSSFNLACFTASSSPSSTSFSQVSSSTLAIKSFFTTFKAFLKEYAFPVHQHEYSFHLSLHSLVD